MATDTILTTDQISNYTLAQFVNINPFVHTANRAVEGDFSQATYKIGDTINIRRQNRFTVGDSQIAESQQYTETSEALVINHQYHTMVDFNSKDLTLSLDRFGERYMNPAVRAILSKMEVDVALQADKKLNFWVGTPGTPLNTFGSIDAAHTKMLQMAVPMEMETYMALSAQDGATIKNALANFFNPTLNEGIDLHSALGHLSVFDMFQSPNIPRHVAGTPGAGPITVSANVTSGASAIAMTGLTASTTVFNAGDLFSIAGVQDINPLSYLPSGNNMQFVVTATTTSDGSGNALVPVAPQIISDDTPLRNVSNAITAGLVVTPLGSYNVNVAYIKRALDLACPPLYSVVPDTSLVTDPDTNISIRLARQGDIKQDVCAFRLDVLCGFLWHPQYAVKVVS